MKSCFPLLFGNEFHKNRIGNAIAKKRLPHALLIDGPRGSGKHTLAKEIAAALNCEGEGDAIPCGMCSVCRRVRSGAYPDVKVLEKKEEKASIGVEEVKLFRSDMFLSATEGSHKVYIIDDAEKMTKEAQNALLIVLEEPPSNVNIILLASGTDSILTTIKSRTQYVPMERFTAERLDEYLTRESADARMLKASGGDGYSALLVSADGVIGRALELLTPKRRAENEEKRRVISDIIDAVGHRLPFTNLYEAMIGMATSRAEYSAGLELLITAICDLISAKKSDGFHPEFFTSEERAKEAAQDIRSAVLMSIYDAVAAAHEECSKNANITLSATNLAVRLKMLI